MNKKRQTVLATDLDGTWIPLQGVPDNQRDLQKLTKSLQTQNVPVIYVTGRHLPAVEQLIVTHPLPAPNWIICEVGATIYQRDETGKLLLVEDYHQHLQQRVDGYTLKRVQEMLTRFPELHLQEPHNQGRFKLSYYVKPDHYNRLIGQVDELLQTSQIPWNLISSIDPFNGEGLFDLLPLGVSKAYALQWWSQSTQVEKSSIIYAGDSGNDFAAFVAGYRTIVVGNADRRLAERVQQEHKSRGYVDRLYLAQLPATSGVLEGCRAFRIV